MLTSHRNSFDIAEDNYVIVFDSSFNITEVSGSINNFFGFFISEEGFYIPLSDDLNKKLNELFKQWFETGKGEDINIVAPLFGATTFKSNIYEVTGFNNDKKYVLKLTKDNSENPLLKKIRELHHEIELFAYRASHDFRSPLLSVLGVIQLIKMDKKGQLNMYLDHIENTVKNLDHNLKEISRQIFNRGLNVELKRIDIESTVEMIISNFGFISDFSKIRINKLFDIKNSFVTDEALFKMIVTNLLSNALNFKHSKSTKHQVDIKLLVNRKKLTLTITDNGIGIPDSIGNKIYEMFYRGTNESKGVGLGLYMTKHAVVDLQGSISHESNSEQTTFKVTLPNFENVDPSHTLFSVS
jgi:signal transduction histidine kinase